MGVEVLLDSENRFACKISQLQRSLEKMILGLHSPPEIVDLAEEADFAGPVDQTCEKHLHGPVGQIDPDSAEPDAFAFVSEVNDRGRASGANELVDCFAVSELHAGKYVSPRAENPFEESYTGVTTKAKSRTNKPYMDEPLDFLVFCVCERIT